MRNLYIVNATQVVVSESNPQGAYSILPDYPKGFDSRNYPAPDGNPNGDEEKALRMAKAEYLTRVGAFYSADNRAMWTVTLTRADGRQIMRESFGAFPDMTPQPEPAPEPESEEPEAEPEGETAE